MNVQDIQKKRLEIMRNQYRDLVSKEGKERFARKANKLKKEIRDEDAKA